MVVASFLKASSGLIEADASTDGVVVARPVHEEDHSTTFNVASFLRKSSKLIEAYVPTDGGIVARSFMDEDIATTSQSHRSSRQARDYRGRCFLLWRISCIVSSETVSHWNRC